MYFYLNQVAEKWIWLLTHQNIIRLFRYELIAGRIVYLMLPEVRMYSVAFTVVVIAVLIWAF